MSSGRQVVIAGAGHAGVHVAAGLRRRGWKGGLMLLEDDAKLPYERPPLSKDLLKDTSGRQGPLLRKENFYADKDIQLVRGAGLQSLDCQAREVVSTNGEVFPYHKLVIATGARARRLEIPGAGLQGVHYLRNHDDALALKDALLPGRRVVVVGAGYIGMEVAAAASSLGCRVTVLEHTDRIMSRVTSAPVSRYFQELHGASGTEFVFGASVEAFEGTSAVEAVRTADGNRHPADVVLVGIGILPNQELAADAGIDCEDGVLVDVTGRTSDPDVYAAGDVARLRPTNGTASVRLECIQSALHQADGVAENIVFGNELDGEVPWFWTVQHDVRLQTAGLRHPDDDLIIRESDRGSGFSVLYVRDGLLAAIDTVNALHDFMPARKLIASKQPIDRAKAADPSVKLSLARA